jgi:hypothetical protein
VSGDVGCGREVDVGVGDVVHEVGQQELGGQGDEFDDLLVVIASVSDRVEVGVGELAAFLDDASREGSRGLPLGVIRAALAGERDLFCGGVVELSGGVAVGRQAVAAAAGEPVGSLRVRPRSTGETSNGP